MAMKRQHLVSLITAVLLLSLAGWLLLEPAGEAGSGTSKPRSVETATPAGALLSGPFTLAVSWQPAFCETAPNKPECRSQTETRFDAANFTLHGLWPDPAGNTYCGVSGRDRQNDKAGRWDLLPAPNLSPRVAQALAIMMPGTQSRLERHEWIKHGTCSGGDAQAYFRASLALLTRLNDSEVQDVFATNVGGRLQADTIRNAFDRAFGKGAGQRVTVECERLNGRTIISELRISVNGDIAASPQMDRLLDQAPTRHRGCPAGEIDRVGVGS